MRFFEKTKLDGSEEKQKKLDNQLEPIPADILGSVVTTDRSTLLEYEEEGIIFI